MRRLPEKGGTPAIQDFVAITHQAQANGKKNGRGAVVKGSKGHLIAKRGSAKPASKSPAGST
jgi:hypothetical protein